MHAHLRLTAILLSVCAASGAQASDWPHLRGPATDGRVGAAGLIEGDDVGLALAWRVPLGSSYSGVAIADGRVVTMFADDRSDLVAALDASSGKELWRFRLGDRTVGHDGSHDGPISSPTIGGGRVFVLATDGKLRALGLADGKPAWQRDLKADFGAVSPYFGFGTTPLWADGILVVEAGGEEGPAIVGLDGATGETVWTHGDGHVEYQSPVLMTLAGTRQLVAGTGREIVGLTPSDGKVLWSHPLGEQDRASSSSPSPAGDDWFVVLMSGGATVYRVARGEAGWSVSEAYRTNALGQNYAPPVYHEGHLYGFRGQVLTCVDASTGERVWRSRPPGGDGLLLVDGHLVIFGAQGNVVIAEADPAGYRERARLQALEGSALTWPSFADGRVYVRNLDEIAAVDVTSGRAATPAAGSLEADHALGRWLSRTTSADDRRARADALFEAHPTMPWIDGDYAHFLYRGPASDVSIHGTMIDTEGAEPLRRLEGTDLFYRSYRLEPGTRWEYRYQIDFEQWTPDPRNEDRVPAVEGDDVLSQFRMPGAAAPEPLPEPAARGRLETFTHASEALGYDKEVRVWLPPGYDDGDERYPLLLVPDGTTWIEKGRLIETLDALVGRRFRPAVVALVAPSGQWWLEAGGGRTDEYVRMLADELVPALGARYRLSERAGDHAVMGNRFYAFSGLYLALRRPDLFGRVAVQSVFLDLGHGEALRAMIREGRGQSLRIYLDWNRYDERNVDRDWDFGRDSAELAALLEAQGYTVLGGERLDSSGWGAWRQRAGDVLAVLLPLD